MLTFMSFWNLIFILLLVLIPLKVNAQDKNIVNGALTEFDKCGFIEGQTENLLKPLEEKWGYGYDSLIINLNEWKQSPYVKVDSIGSSVQQRVLWRLIISDDPSNISNKRTIHIHARTHPQETEGFWVTKEMIKILLSDEELGKNIREKCVVYVVPMINPDGVELEKTRQNANGIDLESNWYTFPNQPEVAALKASFTELMTKSNPIEVALNMHSSSLCERYFVYHHENGTSLPFTIQEQNFINGVSNYFPNGFAPWNYFVSWTNGTPQQYPESWFWLNHGENVMALTYEDKYRFSCTSEKYDFTANAILRGVVDYMGIVSGVELDTDNLSFGFELHQNFPNPFNPSTIISWSSPVGEHQTLKIFDILGNEVKSLVDEYKDAGKYSIEFNMNNLELSSGVYFYKLQTENFIQTKKMLYLK